MNQLKTMILSLFALAFSMFGLPAVAAPVDLTSLTTAVDFSSTTVAILAVAAALITVYIAWKAASMVLAAVRRG